MESCNKEAEHIEETDGTAIDKFSLLPDELVMQIFRNLQDPNGELYPILGENKIRHHCVGCILPLVCKRWNRIANDPYLWTRIKIRNLSENQMSSIKFLLANRNIRILDLDLMKPNGNNMLVDVLILCPPLQCLRVFSRSSSFLELPPITSTSIQHVQFSGMHEDILSDFCQQLPNLTSIDISNNFTASSLCHIANNLNGLKVLIANFQKLEYWDESVRNLFEKQKNNLIQLSICSSPLILTDERAFDGIGQCINLVKLRLEEVGELTDQFLYWIAGLPHLAFLSLDSPNNFTEDCWINFFHNRVCSLKAFELRAFSYSRTNTTFMVADGVTDSGFTNNVLSMLSTNSQLYYLSLCSIPRVTDEGIEAIINNCAEMEILILSELRQVTVKPFYKIPQRMPKLKCLYVDGYNDLPSNEQPERIRQHLMSLGVPIESVVKYKDPFGNILCDHFDKTAACYGQFSGYLDELGDYF